jgi:predicted amidohydrolase
MKTFRVRVAQTKPVLGDLDANLATHVAMATQAADEALDLIVFPELSLTGYYLRDLVPDIALRRDDPRLDALCELSRRVGIVAGFIEESDEYGFFTVSVYFEGGGIVGLHRKVYLPTYGMFDEGRYISPGRRVGCFDTALGRAGILVCEDLWHPALPYVLSQDRMTVLIAPSNSPTRGVQGDELGSSAVYNDMLATYARLFACHVIYCNRVGYEDGVNFWGGSRVLDPFGDALVQAPLFDEGVFDATIDQAEVRRARVCAPLLEDDSVDLTMRELRRITDGRSCH